MKSGKLSVIDSGPVCWNNLKDTRECQRIPGKNTKEKDTREEYPEEASIKSDSISTISAANFEALV